MCSEIATMNIHLFLENQNIMKKISIFYLLFLLSHSLINDAKGAVYVCDSNADTDDNLIYTAGDGFNTLRKCIRLANGSAGLDTINFNLGGISPFIINVPSALPIITAAGGAVIIDGTTQPGWLSTPIVELDGTGNATNCITISTSNCIVKGLVIRNFMGGSSGYGISITSGANSNTIQGNYFGTDVTGTISRSNRRGIHIASSNNNTIGGSNAGEGNIISGSTNTGINLNGSSNNVVRGNYIGLDATGTSILQNGPHGLVINNSSTGNTIGGTNSGDGNIISGSANKGLFITGASANLVQGNFIGIDLTGTIDLGNTGYGISIDGTIAANNNTIGGTSAGAGNLISGNNSYGISIVGGTSGATGNLMQGNYIGTDVSGTLDLGNSLAGILINGANSNIIGGNVIGSGNIVSGNDSTGINLINADNNVIRGNYIGTDVNGAGTLGNTFDGILIQTNSNNNQIGDDSVTAGGNIITNNTQNGILITDAGSNLDLISRNLIYNNGAAFKPINLNALGNANYAAPNTLSATTTSVSGKAAVGDTIEVFRSVATSDPNCINAEVFLGSALTNGTNDWSLGGLSLSGQIVKVNARNNSSNNTSELVCITAPLPIELVAFNASPINNLSVLTEWTTATEINNDYYIVERSKDNKEWEYIGTLDAAGNSSTTLNYQLEDKTPYQGTSYYRLKQTDFNGDFKYYGPVPVRLEGIDIISLYPNPAIDHIDYSVVSSVEDNVSITLIDVLGRKIINESQEIKIGQNKLSINISGFPVGIYMLRLITDTEKYRTQKQCVVNE